MMSNSSPKKSDQEQERNTSKIMPAKYNLPVTAWKKRLAFVADQSNNNIFFALGESPSAKKKFVPQDYLSKPAEYGPVVKVKRKKLSTDNGDGNSNRKSIISKDAIIGRSPDVNRTRGSYLATSNNN